jgi:hypothetical protein
MTRLKKRRFPTGLRRSLRSHPTQRRQTWHRPASQTGEPGRSPLMRGNHCQLTSPRRGLPRPDEMFSPRPREQRPCPLCSRTSPRHGSPDPRYQILPTVAGANPHLCARRARSASWLICDQVLNAAVSARSVSPGGFSCPWTAPRCCAAGRTLRFLTPTAPPTSSHPK